MSADNWASCPRCSDLDDMEILAMEDNLSTIYGKVPMEEYEILRNQIKQAKQDQRNKQESAEYGGTFREDYEFYGAETGTLQIAYCGQCAKCGLKMKFNEEKTFYIKGVGN